MSNASLLAALLAICAALPCLAGPAWDKAKAKDYAALSYAAACNGPDIERFKCTWCKKSGMARGFTVDKYVTDEPTKGAAFTGYSQLTNQIFLVYRSTVLHEWRSILVDFTFDKVDAVDPRGAKHGELHRGFRDAWVGLEKNGVQASLDSLMSAHPDAELVFIGHSLGGALATLAAAQVSSRTGKPVLLYTYGSPRLGDANFGAWFATLPITYYRHVTADDPVPHSPRLMQGYRHVASGQELWFKNIEDGDPQRCPMGENKQCANTVKNATNFAGAHASYLGHKFDQCGLGPIAEFQEWANSTLGKLEDAFEDGKDTTQQVTTQTVTAVTTAANTSVEKGREALAALPGLANLATSTIVEEGKALKLMFQNAQPPRVYLIQGPNDSWQAVVLPADTGELSPSALWPQFGAQVFGDGALLPQAVVVSTKDATVDLSSWPDSMKQSLGALRSLELKQGGNAFMRLRLGSRGALAQVSNAIGLSGGEVQVNGLVGPELVGKLTERLGLPAVTASGPSSYALGVTFPAATPAVFRATRAQFALEFPSTRIDVSGQASAIQLSGTQTLDLYAMGKKTTLTNTLSFAKDGESYTITCNATAQAEADLFGTNALGFAARTVSVGGELSGSAPKQGKASVDGMGLTFGVGFTNGMQGDFAAALAGGKVTELSVSLRMAQPMKLNAFAPFAQLPGAQDFSFREVALGVNPVDRLGYVFGEMEWRSINARAAVMAGSATVNGRKTPVTALFFKAQGLTLTKLSPQIPAAVDVIPLNNVLLVVSRNRLENLSTGQLPSRIKAMVEEVSGATDSKFTFADGLTLITSYAPDPSMKQPLSVLGLGDSPMTVAGQVGGVFSGDPSFGLYADLGTFKLPESSRPGFLTVKNVSPKFFILSRDLKTAPALDLGLELAVGMKVGGDELTMALQAFATFGKAGAGVTAKGTMAGTWNNPLGLQNMAIANTVVGFGLDGNPTATVTMTLGGTMRFDNLTYTTGGILGIATAAPFPGTPTKVGLTFEGNELTALTELKLMDTFVRSAATGPLANSITDPALKSALTALSRSTPLAEHANNAIPLDLVKLKDVHVFMATPGATDPSLPGIVGMGIGAKGKLTFGSFEAGTVESYVTAEQGMKLDGKLNDFSFGPMLALKDARLKIDVPLPPALPSFKMKGSTTVLLATGSLDVEVSKTKLKFVSVNNWGAFGRAELRAESMGRSLFQPTDFVLEMDASADLKNGLRKQLVPALTAAAEASNGEADKGIAQAERELRDLQAATTRERATASKSQESASKALEDAAAKVKKAKGVVKDTKEDIASKKRAIKKADEELKVDKCATLRVELGYLYVKLESTKAGLRIARETLEALDDVTAEVPVDLMPNVVAALAAEAAKRGEIDSLKTAKEASGDLKSLASALKSAAGVVPITIEEFSLRDGRLSTAMKGQPQKFHIKVAVSIDPKNPFLVDQDVEVNLLNPTNVDLRPVADAIGDVFQARKRKKKRIEKLKSTPRAELSAGVIAIGQQRWGDWRKMADCPPNTWAVGYSQRVEADQGKKKDDTALNSVKLVCAGVNRSEPTTVISSHEGWFGTWASSPVCGAGQWLKAGRIRIEPRQGGDKDDTAANDVNFQCTDGTELTAGNGAPWGTWNEYQSCPDDTVVCGVEVRVESKQGDKDDTAMNGLRVRCCELVNEDGDE